MENSVMITCKDCGARFTFTAREQRFYESRGWRKPIRCRACRERKKLRWQEAESRAEILDAMRNSSYMKRDTKGNHLNRSGSTWETVCGLYMPFNDILEYDDLTDPVLEFFQDCYGRPAYYEYPG